MISHFEIDDSTIYLLGDWTKTSVPSFYRDIISAVKTQSRLHNADISFDGSQLNDIDSAGVALIDELVEIINPSKHTLINFSPAHTNKVHIFTVQGLPPDPHPFKDTWLYHIGEYLYAWLYRTIEMIVLTSDVFYWALIGLWDKKGQRKGSFTQQVNLIGIDAIPIVGLLSFIIGLILALQSAVQLKQFGADAFLANLLSFSMVRELSPLITAIILAGRSGSAIAAEVATMKVTEELDALKMMALNPIRYVIVPKFHAVTLCMTLLVTFSIIVSILGGVLIAITVAEQSPRAFIQACLDAVAVKDILLTLAKSTIFAWQIVIIGSHYGFQVQGGAEGVGKATTQAVVSSIFGVIIMDAIFSLVYLV